MRLMSIAASFLLLAGCQVSPTASGVEMHSAENPGRENEPITTLANWRRVQLSSCCEISVPANATDVSGGQLIDSEAGARFQVGPQLIAADLRTLPGLELTGSRRQIERNVVQAGIEGYQNRMTIILDQGPPARQLSVNVTCQERDCVLADRVLSSVRAQ